MAYPLLYTGLKRGTAMRLTTLLLIACCVLSSACQKDKRPPARPACGSDLTLNKNAPLRSDVFRLSRVYAMVKHTNCKGESKVSRVTVKDPKDAYSLSAMTLAPGSGTYEVSALNRTTCDSGTIKPRSSSDTRMEIQFHTSPGTHRTHVLKNKDNIIDYEFRRCLERDAANKCLRSEIAERGTVVLRVEYTESQRPDWIETKETCPSSEPVKP